ncbi:PAP2 superfamily-domain-containing protein [Gongronella butleri]|nr:PAP2 superfamily-domain-containing protein [Gongronella butleri]
MARKVFRTVDVDIDAGTHEEKVYAAALHPWRSHLRSLMLPLVRRETPVLAAMQKRIRSPVLDNYFLWTANLGTHTFFLVFLPILIWFGNAALGRDTVCLAAMGVFWSGFLKDFFCLPRPLSPPVHRLTMSKGAAFEYGFPSTHSTNSISVALYFIAIACEAFPADSAMRLPCILGAAFYASSVVFGRIYCGMHSITDVVGGTLLAYALYWVQWAARDWIQAMINSDAYWVFLTVPLFLILVGIHPDPIERCPCFEDSVCFLGVLIGVFPGSWVCTHTEICVLGLRSNVEAAFGPYTLLIVLMKIALGVALLFVWRLVCKKVCYFILPPIYRAFNLPHRKFEIGAR